MTGAWDAAERRRHRGFRHLTLVAAGTIAAMAVVAGAVGLVSAIEAASGQARPEPSSWEISRALDIGAGARGRERAGHESAAQCSTLPMTAPSRMMQVAVIAFRPLSPEGRTSSTPHMAPMHRSPACC